MAPEGGTPSVDPPLVDPFTYLYAVIVNVTDWQILSDDEDKVSLKEHFCCILVDEKLLFGQVPLLEIDGLKLVQTNSIVRYIGDKAGFIPGDLDERTR